MLVDVATYDLEAFWKEEGVNADLSRAHTTYEETSAGMCAVAARNATTLGSHFPSEQITSVQLIYSK